MPQLVRKAAAVLGRRGTVDEYFEVKVDRRPDGCWQWIGAVNAAGYALFKVAGRGSPRAARWAYERFRETIPPGMTIDHLCRNTSCVNPEHLEVVTPQENRHRQHLAWLAEHPPVPAAPPAPPRRCETCGVEMPTARKDRRNCSGRCRKAASRARLAA